MTASSGEEIIGQLILESLRAGAPGMTPECGAFLAQAASVSLERQGHRPGVLMAVVDGSRMRFMLTWDTVTEQMRNSFADSDYATEHGAYGIAILLVHALTELTVLQRSWKRTGFDYWLGARASAQPLFQDKIRLEVSGIGKGDGGTIRQRERQKIEQVRRYATTETQRLPMIVVIVEYGTPVSRFTQR